MFEYNEPQDLEHGPEFEFPGHPGAICWSYGVDAPDPAGPFPAPERPEPRPMIPKKRP